MPSGGLDWTEVFKKCIIGPSESIVLPKDCLWGMVVVVFDQNKIGVMGQGLYYGNGDQDILTKTFIA